MNAPIAITMFLTLSTLISAPAFTGDSDEDSTSDRPRFVASLPRPPLMDGIGNSHLPVSTDSDMAQRYFDQGLRLMHCFWQFEAYRAFEEASRHDPDLAMAYWGMNKALRSMGPDYKDATKAALDKAVELSTNATEIEQLYIQADAKAAGADDWRKAYIHEMEVLVEKYPGQIEATLFLALAVRGGYDAELRPNEGTLYAQTLLKSVLAVSPDSAGAHHYWIHVVESARPERAIESANRLLKLAPNSGHMKHMPGHIFSKIGDYERAREIFLESKEVDESYMKANNIDPVDNWNYVHNLYYLVADSAESGRFREGLEWAMFLQTIPVSPEHPGNTGNNNILHQGRVPLVQFYLRYERWDKAADAADRILDGFELHDKSSRWFLEGLSAYAQAMWRIR